MLNVASEATTHVLNNRRLLNHRPAQPERAPATSFASMLDDSQAATAQAQADAADTRPARADGQQPTAKASDGKASKSDQTDSSKPSVNAATSDNTTDQPNPITQATPSDQPAADKAAAETKVFKTVLSQNGEPADKTSNDSKPDTAPQSKAAPQIDAAPQIAAAPVPTIDPTQTENSAPAPGATPAATPAATLAIAPAQTPTPKLAPIADGGTDTAPNADDLAAVQGTTGNPAGPAAAGRTAVSTAKPQGPTTDTDAPVAHAREATDQPRAAAPMPDALVTGAGSDAPKSDIAQSLPAPTQNVQTAAPAAAPAMAQAAPQAAAIPLSGVAVEIASKASSGKNHFEIRLDPPELGRIEVRLSVDRDGNVASRLIADRADTLDLLRRDASGLERALQDAGLKTTDNGLQFSLRDQSAYQQQQQQQSAPGNDTNQLVVQDSELPIDTPARSYGRLAGLGGGLDIQV